MVEVTGHLMEPMLVFQAEGHLGFVVAAWNILQGSMYFLNLKQ